MSRLRTALLPLLLLAACGGDDGGAPADDDATDDDDGGDDAPARDAITLPGDDVYPEGIAIGADGAIYVSSIRHGAIYRVAPGADAAGATPFVANATDGLLSPVGLRVDEAAGLLWACSSDAGASPNTGEAAPALMAFGLADGAPRARLDLPGGGFCNDLALADDGAIYLTDSVGQRILRRAPDGDALEVWQTSDAWAGEGFNLNGIAIRDGAVETVKYNDGGLFRVAIGEDGEAAEPGEVPVAPALVLPDGIGVVDGDLVVVEGEGRLTRVVDGVATAIRSDLRGPTTFAVLGEDAWVVEGQLGSLLSPDTAGPPTLPFRLVRVSLE